MKKPKVSKKEIKTIFATPEQVAAAQLIGERMKRRADLEALKLVEQEAYSLRNKIAQSKLDEEVLEINNQNIELMKRHGLSDGDNISQDDQGRWIITPAKS